MPVMIFIAVELSFIPVMAMYVRKAVLITKAFTPRLRYRRLDWLSTRLDHRHRSGAIRQHHSTVPIRDQHRLPVQWCSSLPS
jgi:hypothetical protein